MHIRLRSKKEETADKLFCMALLCALLLFFADSVHAQAVGPQIYRLIGTIQSRKFTGAVFCDSKGEQTFYQLHDVLPDGMKIVLVRDDSISLRGSDGMLYDMFVSHDMKNVGPSGQSVSISPPQSSATTITPMDQQSTARPRRSRHSPHQEE